MIPMGIVLCELRIRDYLKPDHLIAENLAAQSTRSLKRVKATWGFEDRRRGEGCRGICEVSA